MNIENSNLLEQHNRLMEILRTTKSTQQGWQVLLTIAKLHKLAEKQRAVDSMLEILEEFDTIGI